MKNQGDKTMKDTWQTSENPRNMPWIHSQDFHGFSFHNALWSNLRSNVEKKNFFGIFFPYLLRPPRRILQSGCRTGWRFGLHAPFQQIHPHCWRRFGFFCIIVHRVKGNKSFHPTCEVRFGRFGRYSLKGGAHAWFRKTSSPVSASMGRATGSTWSWFRTFCSDESTSQSTVRAFWTAFMQIVCQCLTGVFSLCVGDRSGLMTSRHSCATPLGWERMGCHRCRRVPFSNKPKVADPRLSESNFFAIFGEIAVFAR